MICKIVLIFGLILVGGESRVYVGLVCVFLGFYGMLFVYISFVVDLFENKLMLIFLVVIFVNLGIGVVSKILKERILVFIDLYVDGIMFNIFVIGVNFLVIGFFVGKY